MEVERMSKRVRLFCIALYIIVGFLIYSDVILNGVFLFDDYEYVVGNPIIQRFANLNSSDPRQIGYISFALNYAIDGENPFGYHLVNVVIHIITALLVFFFVEIILKILTREVEGSKKWHSATAFFAGFIFLVHPVQTQAVSYVTQRFTSLCTLFYLLGVVLYLMARLRLEKTQVTFGAYMLYGLSVVSTLLAMKTKEIAFTIPFVLAIFELLIFRNSIYSKRRFIYLIPFVASLIIIPLSLFGPEWGLIKSGEGIAEVVRRDKLYDLYERSPYYYFLTQLRVIVTYIGLLILPINQKAVYDFRISYSLFEPTVLLSLLLHLAVLGSAIYLWIKGRNATTEDAAEYKFMSIGIIWFFITVSVESSVIPIKDIIFEHRVYLPSVGFIPAISILLMRGIRKFSVKGSDPIKVASLTLAIALPLSIATYVRNDVWTSELKFWDDVVKKSPNKAIGYNNRGNAYGKLGMYEHALRDIDKTIAYFPKSQKERMKWESADFTPTNMAKTYMNRGQIYLALGYIDKANADFNRAKQVMFMPVDMEDSMKMANLYSDKGAYDRAIEEYNKILQFDPENIDALNNRGNAYSKSDRYDEAIADFDKVISLRPDFILAYHNRGIAYAWSDQKKRALDDLKTACNFGFKPSCDSIDIVLRGGIRGNK
jgi:lipoprotein NlpI